MSERSTDDSTFTPSFIVKKPYWILFIRYYEPYIFNQLSMWLMMICRFSLLPIECEIIQAVIRHEPGRLGDRLESDRQLEPCQVHRQMLRAEKRVRMGQAASSIICRQCIDMDGTDAGIQDLVAGDVAGHEPEEYLGDGLVHGTDHLLHARFGQIISGRTIPPRTSSSRPIISFLGMANGISPSG